MSKTSVSCVWEESQVALIQKVTKTPPRIMFHYSNYFIRICGNRTFLQLVHLKKQLRSSSCMPVSACAVERKKTKLGSVLEKHGDQPATPGTGLPSSLLWQKRSYFFLPSHRGCLFSNEFSFPCLVSFYAVLLTLS